MSAVARRQFAAGDAVRFGSTCEECREGTMRIVIRLTLDERIQLSAGRLLLVECTHCNNREWAYRESGQASGEKKMTWIEMFRKGLLPDVD